MSAFDESEASQVFDYFSGSDGSMDLNELGRAMHSLGLPSSNHLVHEAMLKADADGSHSLHKDEFLTLMRSTFAEQKAENNNLWAQLASSGAIQNLLQEFTGGDLSQLFASGGRSQGGCLSLVMKMFCSGGGGSAGGSSGHPSGMSSAALAMFQDTFFGGGGGGGFLQGETVQPPLPSSHAPPEAHVAVHMPSVQMPGVTVTHEPQAQAAVQHVQDLVRPGITKALFIGINYPGTSAELRGCVNDVRTMKNLLERTMTIPIDSAMYLVDDPRFTNADIATGKASLGRPTRAEIVNGMKWLVQGSSAGDTLFLHYSGHGAAVRERVSGSEASGKDQCLCPGDYERAGVLIDDDIYQLLAASLPRGVRLTAVFDCCHSGTIMDLPYVAGPTTSGAATHHAGRELPGSTIMFSGCRDDQTSADAFIQASNAWGGALTSALTSILAEKKLGITVVNLLQSVQQKVRQGGYTQVPQLSSSHGFTTTGTFSFFGAAV